MNTGLVRGWLLDTQAMLWMLHGDKRLSKAAVRVINGNLPVYHSSVSFWEIAIKLSGKGFEFAIDPAWHTLLPAELERVAVTQLVPDVDDCRMLQELPLHHRDPFDRMLLCQALRRNLGLISSDTILDRYGVTRVW